jgi:hypothetical protein
MIMGIREQVEWGRAHPTRARHLWPFEHVDALRADSGQQVFEVVGRMHVVRDELVYLVVGEVSLFLACIDQLLYVIELVS